MMTSASSVMQDCFGISYRRMLMAGNGFCGFNSLAFCLTGNDMNYALIIDDCINVFHNCPELFSERTNYAARMDSTRSLAQYEAFMRDAIRQVDAGSCLTARDDEDCWCEDGHFAAISLLYDVAIFVYYTASATWFGFNENASKGYICLVNLPGHLDVLCDANQTNYWQMTAPVIPRAVVSQGICRQSAGWTEAVVALQRTYSFTNVWRWPLDFHGVEIVNNNMLQPAELITSHGGEKASGRRRLGRYYCDVEGCEYSANKKRAIVLHKTLFHRKCDSQLTSQGEDNRAQSVSFVQAVDNGHVRGSEMNDEECSSAKRIRIDSRGNAAASLMACTSDVSSLVSQATCTTRSRRHEAMNVDGGFQRPEIQQCPDCGRGYMDLKNHKRCSKRLQAHDAASVALSEHSDVLSTRSTRSGRVYSDQGSERQTAVKNQCTDCGRLVGNSRDHKTCSCRMHGAETSSLADSQRSEVTNVRSSLEQVNVKISRGRKKTERCPNCGNKFAKLQNHKTCSGKLLRSIARNSNENQRHESATESNVDQSETRVINAESGLTIEQDRIVLDDSSVAMNVTREESVASSSEFSEDNVPTQCGTTRKSHLVQNLQTELEALKKKIMRSRSTSKRQQHDPLYDKLKKYHDELLSQVSNTTTEKLPDEVLDVIADPAVISDCNRPFQWSKADEERLNKLNADCKLLQSRNEWSWAASDESIQGIYNDKRMQFWLKKECKFRIIECPECQSTGLLVGRDQIKSTVCYDCMKLQSTRNEQEKKKKQDAWEKVRPASKDYPKRMDRGHENEDLPKLNAGSRAVLSPVFPVVSVRKVYMADKKLRQECISLVQDCGPTLSKILPRTSLRERFMVIQRTAKDASKRYVVANPDSVRHWLRYLFANHSEFIRMKRDKELVLSEEAIAALESQEELAEVDDSLAPTDDTQQDAVEPEDGLTRSELESGFSESHVFSFDRYPNLYLKAKEVLRIRKEGKIEIIEDPSVRKPVYNANPTLAFPHLYYSGQMSPADFGDHKLGRYLLKKQTMFAHKMADGKLAWNYAADDIHLAYLYSRICEMTVHATVGYYISQHPEVAHLPTNAVVEAFTQGMNEAGLLDSHLPDLTQLLTQVPHSRESWFSERLGIETISQQLGDPNLFVTINLDVRSSSDVRRLIYELEYGKKMPRDHPFEKDTQLFTTLMNKYAPQVAIYLDRKVKLLTKAFFHDICGVEEWENSKDYSMRDRTNNSWLWQRSEFGENRGNQHYHALIKLPFVLETSLLGRIIWSGRVVRAELKAGNIKPDKMEEAWHMIEMGLLASRYVVLFADSISTASFYSEHVNTDGHDPEKVVKLENHREEYVKNYKAGNVTLETNPLMRQFDDPECDPNCFVESAKVASVSCLHECITRVCGGTKGTGEGCRFSYPKPNLKFSVPATVSINSRCQECRILLRRSCSRVANLNRYLLRYLRSNHDVTVLIDAAHKTRYATKYAAKGGKYTELLDEVVEHINKRSMDLLPPNLKQVLSHLVLANCSHRAFMSKQELSFKAMNLPEVRKSFADVQIVGFYQRANLRMAADDETTIEYSDRTEYSAYAERCREDTQLGNGLSREEVEAMNFSDFASTVKRTWVQSKQPASNDVQVTNKRKFRTRDVHSGHWLLTRHAKRIHIRPSTVLYTAPAIDYELLEPGKTTTQTTFFDLPTEKRNQLYRSYYELVMYVPWSISPDDTFLSAEIKQMLACKDTHPEIGSRHSLMRLEEFYKVYRQMYDDGKVAPPGSRWRRDNQYSYTAYLVGSHNRDVHLDRADNGGVYKAQYDESEELVDADVDVRVDVNDETDDVEYPSAMNFATADNFREVMNQDPPQLSEIAVAFPLQHQWQILEELVVHDKAKRFMADPPPAPVSYDQMTPIQQWAVDLGVDFRQQIIYLCGKAGSGKTTVALKICEMLKGRVQAGACTGKAASIFNGPTIHSMFGWSHDEFSSSSSYLTPDSRKIQQLRTFYDGIDVFVIDEVAALSAASLAVLHETMTAIFNPKQKVNSERDLLPFGGKKMLFLGDAAQLRPVGGAAIYDDAPHVSPGKKAGEGKGIGRMGRQMQRTKKGQALYAKYLLPNCIYLQQGQRNVGLLGEICDRIREGRQTEEDLRRLTYVRRMFPDHVTDYGIHYENDVCSVNNLRQLCSESLSTTPKRRIYICKATYHTTPDNQPVIDALACLPPKVYNYAPDVLCVSEGCLVRLVQNINVAAGLVNSATGTVVKVIYNNADVESIVDGKHCPPYCIVVDFPQFHGFVQQSDANDERIHPFPDHPQWVPIYRKQFSVTAKDLPCWVRKRQMPKDCHRTQFPLDLSTNITAHRAQGQTLRDCTVSVDLGLESPDKPLPSDIGSIIYVACTRVQKLKDLFVSSIFPTLWEKIGKSDVDNHRRQVEKKLFSAALDFASNHGMYAEMKAELSWQPDYGNAEAEWTEIESRRQLDTSLRANYSTDPATMRLKDFRVKFGGYEFSMILQPVLRERHIGLDQGTNNFGMAVVEKTQGGSPKIVRAENFTNLQLPDRFQVSDVLLALMQKTDLLLWMQPANETSEVDRVIVHLEQIDPRNRKWKQFAIDLGRMLQQQVADPSKCIVKMSSPHIHRATGPAFRLGQRIIDELKLQAPSYGARSSRPDRTAQVNNHMSDVEPSDSDQEEEPQRVDDTTSEYRVKKKMSADIWKYIVLADEEKLADMKIEVDTPVADYWRQKIGNSSRLKMDDVGDALLHALDEMLCGSTNFRQLIPASPSLHNNRTIAIAMFPSVTFWIVVHCTWNLFVLENFGCYNSGLERRFFKDESTVRTISDNLHDELRTALQSYNGQPVYAEVDRIKIVVKQLTGYTDFDITNVQAGALTEATSRAMRMICDDVVGPNSHLYDRRDKLLGYIHARTHKITGHKCEVVRSTGKHTNAMLCCLEWMKEHVPDFVKDRREIMNEREKMAFFDGLRQLALSDEKRIEMLELSDLAKSKLRSNDMSLSVPEAKRNIADLILIAISKNQQHVKAIAANSRQLTTFSKKTKSSKKD